MNSSTKTLSPRELIRFGIKPVLLGLMLLVAAAPVWAGPKKAAVLPAHANAYGKSLGEWSAAWWQWFMEHPVEGHPGVDSPDYDVTSGQSGKVWFLATPFGTVTREVTIPTGKALCIGLLNAEGSNLEYGAETAADQLAIASWLMDHVTEISVTVDGAPVRNIERYRVQSPQFSFTAPDPWIFSPSPSGEGTATADGYFVLVNPMSRGHHKIHIEGSFHFEAGELGDEAVDFDIDLTYHVTVQ